jgi:hypothetical protein
MNNSRVIDKGPTLIDLAAKAARRTARLESCITTVFVCILAAAASLATWGIIQPIHDEVVRKFKSREPVYFTENSICRVIDLQDFNVLTFPVACFLIILFIIRTKRTSLLRDKCYGYGGPPIPIDFLSHRDRKFAAVVFAICADELLTILEEAINGGSTSAAKPDGVIVVYLLRILRVIIMGFRYYPMLAAVYIDSIFALTCGSLYAWLDYSITIVNLGMCQTDYYPTYDDYLDNSSDIDTMFKYYGTGPNLVAIQLCTDIPRFLCLAYISVKLPMLLIKRIYYRVKKNRPIEEKILRKLTREQRTFFYINRPSSVEMLYVKNLLRSAEERPRTQSLFGRLIPKKIYEWRDDFRFSARVLCVYSSIALLLYFVTIKALILVLPLLISVQTFLQQLMDAITPLIMSSSDVTVENVSPDGINSDTSNFPIPSLVRPYIFAVFLTLVIIVLQLLVLLANMRRNLFQSFRGDDCELPRRQRSKYTSLSSGNVHFAGYFIGYLIWGFIIIAFFSVLICMAIQAFISFGSIRFIEVILKSIIPTLLFVFFKQYLNRLLAQYVFLQRHGEVLALNNRRLLMIFIYFNFFLDAFLGFVSSIVRLIKSLIGGVIYMCRLDYSPLGRKLETMDGGFSAYCGFIHTECQHRHPVMLVFVSHLYTRMKVKQLAIGSMEMTDILKIKTSSRYVRKWKLAVFLIRNPQIVVFRKAFLNQFHMDEIHAINDIHNDDKKSKEKRLSIYIRRMSAAQLSVNSVTMNERPEKERF